jgi:hypothetical protein
MQNHSRIFGFALMVCILTSMLLAACAGPALPREQVEAELVPVMLDYIVHQKLGVSGAVVQSGGHTWGDAPLEAAIVVWAPPAGKIDNNTIEFLNTDQALRVWWFAGNELAEVTDRQEAIRAFRQYHFSGGSTTKSWGYYEFGILSLSNGNRAARIYLGASCGPLCGDGNILTLHRGDSGAWEITGSEMRWIS